MEDNRFASQRYSGEENPGDIIDKASIYIFIALGITTEISRNLAFRDEE